MIDNPASAAQQRADRQRQRLLGNALKRLYAGTMAEPVPEEFLALLEEVDQKRRMDRNTRRPLLPQ